jgi:hypothetical protein
MLESMGLHDGSVSDGQQRSCEEFLYLIKRRSGLDHASARLAGQSGRARVSDGVSAHLQRGSVPRHPTYLGFADAGQQVEALSDLDETRGHADLYDVLHRFDVDLGLSIDQCRDEDTARCENVIPPAWSSWLMTRRAAEPGCAANRPR